MLTTKLVLTLCSALAVHLIVQVQAAPALKPRDDSCLMDVPDGVDCDEPVDCRGTYADTANYGDDQKILRRHDVVVENEATLQFDHETATWMHDLIKRDAVIWTPRPENNGTSDQNFSARNVNATLSPRRPKGNCCRPTYECYQYVRTTSWYAKDERSAKPIKDLLTWKQAFCCTIQYLLLHPHCPNGGHFFDNGNGAGMFWLEPPQCSELEVVDWIAKTIGRDQNKIYPVWKNKPKVQKVPFGTELNKGGP